ncbi:hypothetical protein AXG93_1923s1200 [Marchantia polymorpha subsp. ruderalis]|uniref:Uncharacterized protein n=1 Tax=Marchantia polymorpha subsp. ruderalis TaxID=1480154 RepID=A0A176VCH4_MARPO|nr:hypothetical protein AXG93_1923s1200 [Marchantia polymorpha subsp. ruderalis]
MASSSRRTEREGASLGRRSTREGGAGGGEEEKDKSEGEEEEEEEDKGSEAKQRGGHDSTNGLNDRGAAARVFSSMTIFIVT